MQLNTHTPAWYAEARKGLNVSGQSEHGNCGHAEVIGNGNLVELTSTIEGNTGRLTLTRAEWDQMTAEIKAGRWDHTIQNVVTLDPATPASTTV